MTCSHEAQSPPGTHILGLVIWCQHLPHVVGAADTLYRRTQRAPAAPKRELPDQSCANKSRTYPAVTQHAQLCEHQRLSAGSSWSEVMGLDHYILNVEQAAASLRNSTS